MSKKGHRPGQLGLRKGRGPGRENLKGLSSLWFSLPGVFVLNPGQAYFQNSVIHLFQLGEAVAFVVEQV